VRRLFSTLERAALWVVAGGRCVLCGERLGRGWHADHRRPAARGGETDVSNGQALCPRCNLRKGAREVQGLREWQERAIVDVDAATARGDADFLCVATPGSGKTRFALEFAKRQLGAGCEQVVVVTPSDHLKTQWAQAAARVGIQLNPELSGRIVREYGHGRSFHGLVWTYQSVARHPLVMRAHIGQRPTLVICDEIHHAGDDLSWGKSIREAFERARFRLLLSGTPFRQDNCTIPFVRYDNGRSVADFVFTYGDAIKAGQCVEVYFPEWGGRATWEYDGEVYEHTFDDALSWDDRGRRLNTAIDGDSEFLLDMIEDANRKLLEIRATMPNAGGLVVCKSQDHARQVAVLLKRVTGREPVLAVSDEPRASATIAAFADRRSPDPWLVAVRMVSEGVDIPRVKVGVYATNVRDSELYFRQFVGRFVRVSPETHPSQPTEDAMVYIPKDPDLCAYARDIAEERDHVLEEAELSDQPGGSGGGGNGSRFRPLDGEGWHDGTIHQGDDFSTDELVAGRRLVEQFPWMATQSDAELARVLRTVREAEPVAAVTTPPAATPLHIEVTRLRKRTNKLAAQVARKRGVEQPQAIHTEWLKLGGKPAAANDRDDLLRKRDWLLRRLDD